MTRIVSIPQTDNEERFIICKKCKYQIGYKKQDLIKDKGQSTNYDKFTFTCPNCAYKIEVEQ